LALCALPAAVPLQLVLGSSDIVYKLAVREGPPGKRVDDGRALRIVLLDGFEDGEAGQRGCHSHGIEGSVCDGWAAMAVVCRQRYFVSCQGASEKITRPHGGREMSRISAIDAGFEASEYGRSVRDMLCLEPRCSDTVTAVSRQERKSCHLIIKAG